MTTFTVLSMSMALGGLAASAWRAGHQRALGGCCHVTAAMFGAIAAQPWIERSTTTWLSAVIVHASLASIGLALVNATTYRPARHATSGSAGGHFPAWAWGATVTPLVGTWGAGMLHLTAPDVTIGSTEVVIATIISLAPSLAGSTLVERGASTFMERGAPRRRSHAC